MDDVEVRRIVASADTFFIASCAEGGADVSHRGGAPGFLRLRGDGALCFPDYAGNRFFNTLGNIGASGRAGLFIPDFASGDALLLTGTAGVDWSPARVAPPPPSLPATDLMSARPPRPTVVKKPPAGRGSHPPPPATAGLPCSGGGAGCLT
ncbi:pyridoxamine 5'-phosphate oxidase family protein [Stappia taiwanensis]|uniref:Pyridoxamine 5'-phosphate oxidase family protein n=1 Tax=Stappia taiwanensis TaxID=992267 RepID=A0A838XSX1_9HYPH|nr:pyridoxamine 5'-phosphate oxidase family protein [Stappia taiwanensis]MBA4612837.1 pyridoxamine 5'-phosphate oxidase family protein [Stappia taiwanensis]GGE89621.1 hypothetical protein GCM10007285_16370 [Stappia taiwanensis]